MTTKIIVMNNGPQEVNVWDGMMNHRIPVSRFQIFHVYGARDLRITEADINKEGTPIG